MAKSTRFFGRNVRTVGTADFGATASTLETGERVGTAVDGATVSTLETGVGGAIAWDVGTVVRITKATLGVKREKSSGKREKRFL